MIYLGKFWTHESLLLAAGEPGKNALAEVTR